MDTETIRKTSTIEQGVGLSAPWYSLQRTISYTIGQSAQVMVSTLDESTYQIEVITVLEDTAKGIANTIKLEHQLGNITVKILVKDINGNMYQPNEVPHDIPFNLENLKLALVNNPLVYEITEFKSLAAICCSDVLVQYWNDDLSNPYSFTSMTATDAFRQVFREEIYVFTIGKKIGNF